MRAKRLIAAATCVWLLAACGDGTDASTAETTTTEVAAGADEAGDTGSDDVGPEDLGIGTCSASQLPAASSYTVANISADDPDGGLVARQLPGADEDEIDVLAEGTVVDADPAAEACAVTDGGGLWWNIGTPQLATGGWVNSSFLEPIGSPPDTDQDSYDLDEAQIACIYGGDGGACDILEQDGYTAQGNYGLGNSYSMAPDEAISAQCDDGDSIACAEQESRRGE